MYIHPCVQVNHSVNPFHHVHHKTHVHMNWCRYSCREQLCPNHEATAPLIPSFLSKVVWPLPMSSCYLSRAMVVVVSSSLWLQMASFLSWPQFSGVETPTLAGFTVSLSVVPLAFSLKTKAQMNLSWAFCGVWTSTPVSVAVAFLVMTWAFCWVK